jgi:hypothetical protein
MGVLKKADWLRMGARTRDFWRKWTFIDSLDVNGDKFNDYSEGYGERKRGNSFKRQATQFKDKTAPVLTSDLLRDLEVKGITSKGFKLGWTSEGAKIKWLADNGRVISSPSQLVPGKMDGIVQGFVLKAMDNMLGKSETRTFNL